MPDKLLNIKEAAAYLGKSEKTVKKLVRSGKLPAYKIGGTILRFKKDQLNLLKEDKVPPSKEQSIPIKQDVVAHDQTARDKIRDFMQFNDFYMVAFLMIIFLTYILFFK